MLPQEGGVCATFYFDLIHYTLVASSSASILSKLQSLLAIAGQLFVKVEMIVHASVLLSHHLPSRSRALLVA